MEEIDKSRRKARRRMAWISFSLICLFSVLILLGVTVSEDRETISQSLDNSSSVIGAVFTVLASIVLGYLGVSVAEQIWKR